MLNRIAPRQFSLSRLTTLAMLSAASVCANAQTDAVLAQRDAFIFEYCTQCHNSMDYTGSLDFWEMDIANVHDDADRWEKVIRKLETGQMPPRGEERPDPEALNAFLGNLVADLDSAEANPGNAGLRRMNRTEYGNAVRDLLGINVDVRSMLPPDDSTLGFDNIALGINPLLLEQYLTAATRISRLMVGSPEIPLVAESYRAAPDLSQDVHLPGLPLGTRGGLRVEHNFPLDGDYHFDIRLMMTTVDQIKGVEFEQQADIWIDDELVHSITFGGLEDFSLGRGAQRVAVEDKMQVTLPVTAGSHEIAIAFVDENSALNTENLSPFIKPATVIQPLDPIGPPHLDRVTITGPYNPVGPGNPEYRERLFSCRPGATLSAEECAYDILSELAQKAYRRPVSDEDLNPVMRLFAEGNREGSFDQGIDYALRYILSNPKFIFRFEETPESVVPGDDYFISDLELASRLSFFIWSSIPDEELLETAINGRLSETEVLNQQIERMLQDEKSFALSENFAGQWLYLRNLSTTDPDPQKFPDWDDNLRQAMLTETQMLFDSIVREDRSVLDLLNADYSFINERLALHYGYRGIRGERFRRVSVPEERRGLLGHGSILTVTSHAHRTSPVLRGKFILENMMGTPPPAPPPNVPDLQATSADGVPLSIRQQMEQHRANPVCASCHNVMDPLGLALENFDALGRWRELGITGRPIDASGELSDGTPVSGPQDLRAALMANPEIFVSTMLEKMYIYALGRPVEYYDYPTMRRILEASAEDNYSFSSLVEGIANSIAFQMNRNVEDAATLSMNDN